MDLNHYFSELRHCILPLDDAAYFLLGVPSDQRAIGHFCRPSLEPFYKLT